MTEKGVLYIATGDDFFGEASISAKSLKENNPGLDVACITNKDRDSEVFDQLIIKEPNEGSDKIYYLEESPYEETLFLDTDTYITDEISELFDLLDQFDIGLAQSPTGTLKADEQEKSERYDNTPQSFPEMNTGVVVYRNDDRFRDFSSELREVYERQLKRQERPLDQPSFRSALYKSDLRIASLPEEYNCRLRSAGRVSDKVKIAHARLTEVGDKWGLSKKMSTQNGVKQLNSESGLRVFYYYKGGLKTRKRKESIFKMLSDALDQYGALETLKRALNKIKEGRSANEL